MCGVADIWGTRRARRCLQQLRHGRGLVAKGIGLLRWLRHGDSSAGVERLGRNKPVENSRGAGLGKDYQRLDRATTVQLRTQIEAAAKHSSIDLDALWEQGTNVEYMSNAEIRDVLRSIGGQVQGSAYLINFGVDVAIALSYEEFVEHFDDLWFPGRDDVWLIDDQVTWLLTISHEEVVSFTRFSPG